MNETMSIQILAEVETVANIIFAVVVVIIAIVGSIVKKSKEQASEADATARREAARRRRREQQPAAEDDGWITLQEDTPRKAPPPPPTPEPRPGPHRLGGDEPPRPLRPAPPSISGSDDVAQARAKARKAQAEARRLQAQASQARGPMTGRRMTSQQSASSTDAIRQSEIGIKLELSKARTARRAIIYHEVFGPPKAMQETPPVWDR